MKVSSSLFALLFFTMVIGCQPFEPSAPSSEELEAVMNAQVDAWNKGDIGGYMDGYWKSDSLIFTGGKSITYGHKAALERYKKSYKSQKEMGILDFQDVRHQFLGDANAFTVGEWILYRENDTLSGRYTLVWKLESGHWKIIADHSS